MQKTLSEINYDQLINNHLKGVIADALIIASTQGLPGENHFYITFKTDFPGVEISKMLQTQYPESMTIVLQHQFANLVVDDEKFSVELVFGGIPHTLVIPFDAISYFADPYARFGLSFDISTGDKDDTITDKEVSDSTASAKQAEVISIESFRKKS